MSPHCHSLLLLQLAVVSVLGSPVQHMSKTHDSIADVLALKDTEISGRPLFNSVIKSINTACLRQEQVQLMNVTLDIYAHVFSSILHHQHPRGGLALLEQVGEPSRSQVVESLMKLQKGMEDLRKSVSRMHHQNPSLEDVLRDLRRIQVDDPVEQRRALAQFKEVYQAATVISGTCGSSH